MAEMPMPSQGGMPPAMPPEAQGAPKGQPPAPMQMGGEEATPEEQDQYDQIVANAMNIVYDEKMMPSVVKMLEGGDDPIEGLARTASMIIMRVAQSAQESGVPLNAIVAFHAGTEIFEDLADLSREADIKDFSSDPDALEAAYFRALDYARTGLQDSGAINPETATADMKQLADMDASGQLEQMLMGLAERDAQGSEPKQRGLMPEGM